MQYTAEKYEKLAIVQLQDADAGRKPARIQAIHLAAAQVYATLALAAATQEAAR